VDLDREAAGRANGVAAADAMPALGVAATDGTATNVCFHCDSLLYCRFLSSDPGGRRGRDGGCGS
jgi:hypothetical protein